MIKDDFEKLKEYVEYLAKSINGRSDYLESEITEIKEIMLNKKNISKYLDKIDINVLEQYIRKRKLNKINELR